MKAGYWRPSVVDLKDFECSQMDLALVIDSNINTLSEMTSTLNDHRPAWCVNTGVFWMQGSRKNGSNGKKGIDRVALDTMV